MQFWSNFKVASGYNYIRHQIFIFRKIELHGVLVTASVRISRDRHFVFFLSTNMPAGFQKILEEAFKNYIDHFCPSLTTYLPGVDMFTK